MASRFTEIRADVLLLPYLCTGMYRRIRPHRQPLLRKWPGPGRISWFVTHHGPVAFIVLSTSPPLTPHTGGMDPPDGLTALRVVRLLVLRPQREADVPGSYIETGFLVSRCRSFRIPGSVRLARPHT
jgi:hypothetical protein